MKTLAKYQQEYQNKPVIRILRLTLNKKWFDMIASGEKKEEYREIKKHWISRLTKKIVLGYGAKPYDLVEFTNGYGKNKPRLVMEWLRTEIGAGKPKWGGDPNYDQFIIRLGREISRHNF